MSGRVARIVSCAAGPLENWLSPPCSAWWIQSSEKMSEESLCIASSAADFVPRAGCTPPGSTSCCTRTIRWPNELFDRSSPKCDSQHQNSRSFSSIVCSATGRPRTTTRPRPRMISS